MLPPPVDLAAYGFPLEPFEALLASLGWPEREAWIAHWQERSGAQLARDAWSIAPSQEWIWGLALPLLSQIEALCREPAPSVLGLSAIPATGKTTLCRWLRAAAAELGLALETISIDEFYFASPQLDHCLAGNPWGVGFGGAGGMVHPASGYMVGSLLRRAPSLAQATATCMADSGEHGSTIAATAWQSLWPLELRPRHGFYRFGLSKLMGFEEARLRHPFHSFFQLPDPLWYGFLTNTLSVGEPAVAMARLFGLAPWDVRAGLLLPAQQPPGWRSAGPACHTNKPELRK